MVFGFLAGRTTERWSATGTTGLTAEFAAADIRDAAALSAATRSLAARRRRATGQGR